MRKFEVRWRNFRSFEDTGWLAIRPLTLLIGPNNSGKTSLIAPLLVLKQTLDSHDLDLTLKTSGDLLNIGSFKDFIYRHDSSKLLTFEFRWSDILPKKNRKSTENDIPQPASLTLEFSQTRKKKIVLRRYLIRDVFNKALLSRYLTTSGRYSLNFPHKLPRDTQLNRAITKRIRSDQPRQERCQTPCCTLPRSMRSIARIPMETHKLGREYQHITPRGIICQRAARDPQD